MSLTAPERLAWLRRVALFRGCSEASLLRLAEVTAEVDFPAGRYIVEQGQVGNGLFVVISGTARAQQGDVELARLGPGDVLGELAVIDQLPRANSVIAETPCSCLALASWDLLALIEHDPKLALNLLIELTQRIRSLVALHSH